MEILLTQENMRKKIYESRFVEKGEPTEFTQLPYVQHTLEFDDQEVTQREQRCLSLRQKTDIFKTLFSDITQQAELFNKNICSAQELTTFYHDCYDKLNLLQDRMSLYIYVQQQKHKASDRYFTSKLPSSSALGAATLYILIVNSLWFYFLMDYNFSPLYHMSLMILNLLPLVAILLENLEAETTATSSGFALAALTYVLALNEDVHPVNYTLSLVAQIIAPFLALKARMHNQPEKDELYERSCDWDKITDSLAKKLGTDYKIT